MTREAEEVLFEFRRLGNAVQVVAMHVPTLTEVKTMGPAGAGEAQLKALALQKLRYVLEKKA